MAGSRIAAFERIPSDAEEVVEGSFNDATMGDKYERLVFVCADQFAELPVHAARELADRLEVGPEAMVAALCAAKTFQGGHEGFSTQMLIAALPLAKFGSQLNLESQSWGKYLCCLPGSGKCA